MEASNAECQPFKQRVCQRANAAGSRLAIAFSVALSMLVFGAAVAEAKTISLEGVIEKTMKNSFDLKMADVDSKIARADSKIARADLFPTLTGGYNTQYSKGLNGQKDKVR